MSFLDRFKPQPRWKHADPAVRAAAVAELPTDAEHDAVLRELAQSDDDVRVRRAAAARLDSAADLVLLVRVERDEEHRRELQERLVEIANAPAETDAEAAIALTGLADQKQLAAVARTSPHENVRAAALGQVRDTRVLSGVARGAAHPETALEAVNRVVDVAELVNIATKTEHKEAGVAALEKAAAGDPNGAREMLDGVAARAKNKSVAKRARTMVQTILDAEAAQRAALEVWQQHVASVMARLEAIGAAPSRPSGPAELAAVEAEWRELSGGSTFELDPDSAARHAALFEAAQEALARHEREERERLSEAERLETLRASRLAICERLEAASDEDAAGALETARAEWEGLPAPSDAPPDDEAIRQRFEDACRRARERHENREERQRISARLDALAQDAQRVAGAEDASDAAWQQITSEWATVSAGLDSADPSVIERFSEAQARVQQRADERKAAAEKALRQQVQRTEQLIERAHKRATAEDLTLREADRLTRDLRGAVEAPPHLPDRDRHALVERVKAAQTAVAPRLHELREMDEWKRFANAAVQEELIAKAEALMSKYGFDKADPIKPEDLEQAARQLHEIQERWKQAAEAPRAQAQTLWHRYRQAADPIQARVRDFFAHRAEERKINLERKLALIARAEQLADSTDWIKTAEELKRLQAEWQEIGPVPRQEMRATWKRFREACDRFFTRRNADLAQRKETWAENLARKEALCARAEALASSTEWERAAAEIRHLQAEWKTIGPVRRNKSEVIWQRFRAACDAFFDRYKRRDQIELETKQADREALVAELESLAPAGGEGEPLDPAAVLERVRSLRSRWNQSTPVVRHGADPLSGRFVGALERLLAANPEAFRGTELDVEANRQKMEKLCLRVEGFLNDGAGPEVSSSQALAAMLREALAANTIGGRAGEESKWRAMAEDVRQAQAAWNRLGPVPGEAGQQLADRFHRACSRFFENMRRRVPPPQNAPRGKPVGAR
jgi:Domain of Unknown Function (DUF349)